MGGGGGALSVEQKPLMQSSFCAQSSSVLQAFFALQAPFDAVGPPGHSLSLLQARHWFAMHASFAGQSAWLLQ